ncbi:MAG: hypothetical protein AABX02_01585, partial [archaeon]
GDPIPMDQDTETKNALYWFDTGYFLINYSSMGKFSDALGWQFSIDNAENVLAHEFGHSLGLGHTMGIDNLMGKDNLGIILNEAQDAFIGGHTESIGLKPKNFGEWSNVEHIIDFGNEFACGNRLLESYGSFQEESESTYSGYFDPPSQAESAELNDWKGVEGYIGFYDEGTSINWKVCPITHNLVLNDKGEVISSQIQNPPRAVSYKEMSTKDDWEKFWNSYPSDVIPNIRWTPPMPQDHPELYMCGCFTFCTLVCTWAEGADPATLYPALCDWVCEGDKGKDMTKEMWDKYKRMDPSKPTESCASGTAPGPGPGKPSGSFDPSREVCEPDNCAKVFDGNPNKAECDIDTCVCGPKKQEGGNGGGTGGVGGTGTEQELK